MAIAPLVVAGSAEQRQRYLEPLTAAPRFAALCLPAYERSGQARALHTVARSAPGGGFLLSGQERWVANAAHADWFVVFAQDGDGVSAFVVPAEAAGVSVGQREQAVGLRAADLAPVSFKDVPVGASDLIGGAGDGAAVLAATLARVQPLMASLAVGVARAAMDNTIAYAKEVGFMVADMARDIEAGRLLLRQAAWLADQGQPALHEGAVARTHAVDAAVRVAIDAVQVYGGYGYSKEYPVEKLMRDAKALQLFGGSSQKARARLAAHLVGIA
jgi:acyl-CoA dehydrogenase